MKGPGKKALEEPTEIELELMKERAGALGRSGWRVERCLKRMEELEREIEELKGKGEIGEANRLIEEFNRLREEARTYLHYLVIHREAVGFRRHPDLERLYPIPDKRSPIADGVREDNNP